MADHRCSLDSARLWRMRLLPATQWVHARRQGRRQGGHDISLSTFPCHRGRLGHAFLHNLSIGDVVCSTQAASMLNHSSCNSFHWPLGPCPAPDDRALCGLRPWKSKTLTLTRASLPLSCLKATFGFPSHHAPIAPCPRPFNPLHLLLLTSFLTSSTSIPALFFIVIPAEPVFFTHSPITVIPSLRPLPPHLDHGYRQSSH